MLTDTSEIRINAARPPAERLEPEYLDWLPEDSPFAIHLSLGAIDGIARDVLEGLGSVPRRDVEVGGLLLGRIAGGAVWIERYQRIPCEHSFGPHFILANQDVAAHEEAATKIFENREMAVVGLYRSHTRPGLQLEESDFDLMRRYFSDPTDLVLLVKSGKGANLFAQFYRYDVGGGARPVGDRFPFLGNVVTPDTGLETPDTARTLTPGLPGEQTPDDRERTRPSEVSNTEAPRRLVPDFPDFPVEPAPSVLGLSGPASSEWQRPAEAAEEHTERHWRKWLPLLGALVLAGGVGWFLISQGRIPIGPNAAPAPAAENARPLGLYVDPVGENWRVLWNPNATALHDARSVQLFVREGDDQNRIQLSANALAKGSYDYPPMSNDVTFRLEVADKNGNISAESFRLMRAESAAHATQASRTPPAAETHRVAPAPPPVVSKKAPLPPFPGLHTTQPTPTYRAPPVVAGGIRPRIKGTVPIDVRVRIDERGRVVSATTITKLHDGIERYLGGRAVQAARQWRFEPARENGKAVPGSQTIHFVFTK
jgi:hypothetical protein